MSQYPLFSIAIPTYNRLGLLKQTLASAQNQDYPHLEIVILNNGSDDGTFEYLETAALQDSRIRLVHHEKNIGPIENPRQIPDHVQGKYLLVLGDDDLIEPTLCSTAVAVMEQNPDISLYVAKADYFYGSGEYAQAEKHLEPGKQEHTEILEGKEFIKRRLTQQLQMAWCSTVYRMDKLKSTGGLAPIFSMDLQSMCLVVYDQQVFMDKQVLGHYRIHTSNTSAFCWKDPHLICNDLRDCFVRVKDIYHDSSLDLYFFKYLIFCSIAESDIRGIRKTAAVFLPLAKVFKISKATILFYCWYILARRAIGRRLRKMGLRR